MSSKKLLTLILFSPVDNVYNTIQDLRDALLSREVEGVLIDAYTAGSSGSLFVKPGIRAVEVLRYPRSYGLVLSGRMANLADEARVYLASNQNEILKLVESNTQKMKVINFKKYFFNSPGHILHFIPEQRKSFKTFRQYTTICDFNWIGLSMFLQQF